MTLKDPWQEDFRVGDSFLLANGSHVTIESFTMENTRHVDCGVSFIVRKHAVFEEFIARTGAPKLEWMALVQFTSWLRRSEVPRKPAFPYSM